MFHSKFLSCSPRDPQSSPSLGDPKSSNCRLVLLILLALTALLVLNVLALLLARCGHGQRWLNLGANVNPGAASQVLRPGHQT